MLILLLVIIAILLLLIYLKMSNINPQDFFGEILNIGIVLLLVTSPVIIGLIIYIAYQNFGNIINYITSIKENMPAWMDEPIPPWVVFVFIGIIIYFSAKNQENEKINKK